MRANSANSCPLCGGLGESLYADFDENQEFPEAVRKLEMAYWFDDLHDLRRCPECGRYYDFTYRTDNDIFQPTHTGEYRRISAEEGEAMIAAENARKKKWASEYRRKLRRKHAAAMDALDADGKRMLARMLLNYDLSADPDVAARELGMTAAEASRILEELVRVGIAYRRMNKAKGDWHDNYGLAW